MNYAVILLIVSVASVYSQGGFGYHDLGKSDHQHLQEYIDYRAPPKYHFDYAVHDAKHHDFKSQHEVRNDKDVKGSYELLQPDGRKRIVQYVAGKHGADYIVKYEGKSNHGGIGSYGHY